jgi:hypothetical protein
MWGNSTAKGANGAPHHWPQKGAKIAKSVLRWRTGFEPFDRLPPFLKAIADDANEGLAKRADDSIWTRILSFAFSATMILSSRRPLPSFSNTLRRKNCA